MNKSDKIIITGAAGLVGQNLILLMREQNFRNIVAIDKHQENLILLQKLNPGLITLCCDLSIPGNWESHFIDATSVIMLHAQITGLIPEEFEKNNIIATTHVLNAIKKNHVSFTIHVSSSVVNTLSNDDYTQTKKQQELLVRSADISCCILRPTLMFGWFDPKHLGWLSRFMEKIPVFPIPGHGKYLRQPLYCRDFCKIILSALNKKPAGKTFDIVGQEEVDYIKIIYLIKKTKNLNTVILKVPYAFFYILLKIAGLLLKKPPFTVDQLQSLIAGDYFTGVDYEKEFSVAPTPLTQAFEETYQHKKYSSIVVKR